MPLNAYNARLIIILNIEKEFGVRGDVSQFVEIQFQRGLLISHLANRNAERIRGKPLKAEKFIIRFKHVRINNYHPGNG